MPISEEVLDALVESVYGDLERERDRIFRVLGDVTRRNILLLLRNRDQNVSEIVPHFDRAQPTISRHLSLLKDAQLVEDERMGQNVLYRLTPKGWGALQLIASVGSDQITFPVRPSL